MAMLRGSFLLFALILAGPVAVADKGFFLPQDLPPDHRPSGLERALRASVRLELGDGASCSGAIVSPAGHVLTALHCVESCLERHGLVSRGFANFSERNFQSRSRRPGAWCSRISIPELRLLGARLLAVGRGVTDVKARDLVDLGPRQLAAIQARRGDWALLRVRATAPLSCVKLSRTPVKPGDPVWIVGFPDDTVASDSADPRARPERMSSDGVSEYVGYGAVAADLSRNDSKYYAALSPAGRRATEAFFGSSFDFISSVDAWIGNSGGMLINAGGELVGIDNSLVDPRFVDYGYSTDNVIAARAAEIRASLVADYGEGYARRAFACD
jgi:hypothetical protein